MRNLLALLALLASSVSLAQISSTRETSYDWACCDDQGCATLTSHQRFDTALLACLNRSVADGKPRWVQGGRYKIGGSLPTPAPSTSAINTTGKYDSYAIASQSDGFTLAYTVIPASASVNLATGVAGKVPTSYTDINAIVRFNAGVIDAFDGKANTYRAESLLKFDPAKAYRVTLTVGASSYSASVDGQVIAKDYGFRGTAPSAFTYLIAKETSTNLGTVISQVLLTPNPPVTTASVTVNWAAPVKNTDGTTLTDLQGFQIHYGKAGLTQVIDVPGASATSVKVAGLTSGKWDFAVTAYSPTAESDLSNVVSRTIP